MTERVLASHHIKKCTECFPISCIIYEKCPVYWFYSMAEATEKFDVLNANIYRIWLFTSPHSHKLLLRLIRNSHCSRDGDLSMLAKKPLRPSSNENNCLNFTQIPPTPCSIRHKINEACFYCESKEPVSDTHTQFG